MSGNKSMVAIPGRLVFADLVTPALRKGAKPGENPRYQAAIQTSKDSPAITELWSVMAAVAKQAWGAQAKAKLGQVFGAISQGVSPANSPVTIQDGDLYQPEYNAGFYFVRATQRGDREAPAIYDEQGARVADASTNPAGVPTPGDGVLVLINVWAQPDYERMNLTLTGVRLVQRGVGMGGPPREEIEAGLGALSVMSLPASIPGVQPAAQIAAGAPAPAAAVEGEWQTPATGAPPAAQNMGLPPSPGAAPTAPPAANEPDPALAAALVSLD